MDSLLKELPVVKMMKDNLPPRPMATDDFKFGVKHYDKSLAMLKNYIQYNSSTRLGVLCIDIDYAISFNEIFDSNMPIPNIISFNPENEHAHLFYVLKTPVHNSSSSSKKAVTYFQFVQDLLTDHWEGDSAYAHTFSKNPWSPSWNTIVPNLTPYELDELRGWFIDDEEEEALKKARKEQRKKKKARHVSDVGRNCNLFDSLRFWAYDNYNLYMENWHENVLKKAEELNAAFDIPLPFSEVKATAKSVSTWVENHFHKEHEDMNALARKQRNLELLEKANEVKLTIAKSRKDSVRTFLESGCMTQTKMAEVLHISRMQVSRYVKEIREEQEHNEN